VLAFHGGGGNARQFQETSRIAELADQEGFLAIFPDGTGLIGLHFWNAGNCCGRARLLNVDDVGFVAAVLDDLDGRASINTTRIYATGHSNGAMMSYRLAVELGNRLAAIAPVGGAMNLAEFRPVRAIPVLHIHSADDPRALYEGGEGPPFPGTNQTTVHRPVEEGLALWRGVNGCPATPVVVRELAGGATGPDAAHTATLRRWEPCMSGAPVELWRLTVAGHGWPGQVHGLLPDSLMGPSTAVLNAAEEIWNFVRRFP
jgi:polyhydroxybutyrate depolymerase